jgi:hypothetical protein
MSLASVLSAAFSYKDAEWRLKCERSGSAKDRAVRPAIERGRKSLRSSCFGMSPGRKAETDACGAQFTSERHLSLRRWQVWRDTPRLCRYARIFDTPRTSTGRWSRAKARDRCCQAHNFRSSPLDWSTTLATTLRRTGPSSWLPFDQSRRGWDGPTRFGWRIAKARHHLAASNSFCFPGHAPNFFSSHVQ